MKLEEAPEGTKFKGFLCGFCEEFFCREECFVEHVQSHHSVATKTETDQETNSTEEITRSDITSEGVDTGNTSSCGSQSVDHVPDENLEMDGDLATSVCVSDKKFKCDVCSYVTDKRWNLKIHARLHSGDLPYSCIQCDYKCNEKRQLQHHAMKHTGERPFKCDSCSYATARKNNLVKHARLLSGDLPYSCSQCDYKCNQKQQLKCHVKKHSVSTYATTL